MARNHNALAHPFFGASAFGGAQEFKVSKMFSVMLKWYARYQQRRSLAELTTRELDDLGISEFEAMTEAQKPFWSA